MVVAAVPAPTHPARVHPTAVHRIAAAISRGAGPWEAVGASRELRRVGVPVCGVAIEQRDEHGRVVVPELDHGREQVGALGRDRAGAGRLEVVELLELRLPTGVIVAADAEGNSTQPAVSAQNS